MSLLIVGTVAFDQVETPAGNSGFILGGAATYIGLASSLIAQHVSIVSVVGEDFPDEYLKLFRNRKINIQGLKVISGGKTFFWAGRYHADMNCRQTLVTDLNVLAGFDPVVPEPARNSKFVMLGNLTPAIQKKVLMQMAERPKFIAMDTMNFWMDSAWDELMEVVKMVDLLTINEEEARQLSGELQMVKAAKKILKMGPKFLIIKRGEYGALLFATDKVFFCPAVPLENVIDPTGAGDTFAGGFMGYLAKADNIAFETIKTALAYGAVMASFTVENFGTKRLLEITADDINARMKHFQELSSFQVDLL